MENSVIAQNYDLFGTYIDPDATVSEDQFDAMSFEDRLDLIESVTGN